MCGYNRGNSDRYRYRYRNNGKTTILMQDTDYAVSQISFV